MNSEQEQPRIGIFICHCGTNIGGFVDVPDVAEYAKTLPNVVHAEHNLYTCADDGLTSIKNAIKEHNLNRLIVASCTPRTHAPLFQHTCESAGLNPYLFEFVNIREHCSWVHMKEKEEATLKAKDLVRMGVARANLLQPQAEKKVDVIPKAVVIGGGVAGMSASLSLANQGFKTYLVEKRDQLGGMVRNYYKLTPTNIDAVELIENMASELKKCENIEMLMSSTVKDVEGYIGNFKVTVEGDTDKTLEVGTIIVATGAQEYKPDGLYEYGKDDRVVTTIELEKMMRGKELEGIDHVIMIQCVGSRGEAIPYCSRVCCMTAIKNAIYLKEEFGIGVNILHNEIRVYGDDYEALYRKAQEIGVHFNRFGENNKPNVINENGKLTVEMFNEGLSRVEEYPADLIVLSTPMVNIPEAEELSKMLKVPLGQDRFFFEAHVKLRPLDFATDGIYLCGTAHAPATIPEAIAQGYGAASRASIPLTRGYVQVEAITSYVDENKCRGCGKCVEVCEYKALELIKLDTGREVTRSNEVLCKGCGTCATTCCNGAISMKHFSSEQIISMIEAALTEPALVKPLTNGFKPNIIAFCCNWCSYAGADLAGVSRFQYPPNVRIIRVMCSGRIEPNFVFKAFEKGADGVLVTGCHIGDCHYISGNQKAEDRMNMVRNIVHMLGLEKDRFGLVWISASEGQKFAELMTDFISKIKELGPTPFSIKK
ncbi:MAG: hydrogenase iron-sulfur subunit [Thermoplasmata archaeon]|nr:MAG: hydrogenase iron-sulfur subunit [Thermoplasmata archaeon]